MKKLYELIHILPPKTIKGFLRQRRKRSHSSHQNSVSLLNIILKNNIQNNTDLKNKTKNKKYHKYLPVAKTHLYNALLQEVIRTEIEEAKSNNFYKKILQVLVLKNRGMYEQALFHLEQLIQQLVQNEQFHFDLFLSLSIKTVIYKKLNHKAYSYTSDEKIYIKNILNLLEYRTFLVELYAYSKAPGLPRNPSVRERVVQISKHPLFQDDSRALTKYSKNMLYYLKSTMSFFLKDYNQNLKDVLLAKQYFAKEEGLNYFRSWVIRYSNLLFATCRANDLMQFEKTYKIFHDLYRKEKDEKLTLDFKYLLHSGFRLYFYIWAYDIENADREYQKHRDFEELFEGEIMSTTSLTIMVYFIRINIWKERYAEALDWAEKILRIRQPNIVQKYVRATYLLYIISHYELGNEWLLNNQLNSIYNYLKKNNLVFLFEKTFFQLFRKILNTPNERQLKKVFLNYKDKFISMQEDVYQKEGFENLRIVEWLDKKIKNA